MAVLVADTDGHDAALSEVLADLNAGREPSRLDLAVLAPQAMRLADGAEELLALIRESGSLRVGLMASANPFRTGGIAGRSRKVRLLRVEAERDTATTGAVANRLRGQAEILERTRAGRGLGDTDAEISFGRHDNDPGFRPGEGGGAVQPTAPGGPVRGWSGV